MTQRARTSFTVEEFPSGEPWIYFERVTEDGLKILGNGFLGFDLKRGTTNPGSPEDRRLLERQNRKRHLHRASGQLRGARRSPLTAPRRTIQRGLRVTFTRWRGYRL